MFAADSEAALEELAVAVAEAGDVVQCGEELAMVSPLPPASTSDDASAECDTASSTLQLVRSNERPRRNGDARAAVPPGVEQLPRQTHDTDDTRPQA
jgi:hypothetical protein